MSALTFRHYALTSTVAWCLFVGYASWQYDDFYLLIAHLTTSKLGLAIMYNFYFMSCIAFGKLLMYTFVGRLQNREFEQLVDIGRAFLWDNALFLALASPTIDGKSVPTAKLLRHVLFLIALKAFHIIAQFRVQVFDVGIPRLSVMLRLCLMMLTLLLVDLIALSSFYHGAFQDSSFYLWLFFQTLGMACCCCVSLLKYTVHIVDVRLEHGWRGKAAHLFFLDLINDVAGHVTFLVFMAAFPLKYSNFHSGGGPDWEMVFFIWHALHDMNQVFWTLHGKLLSYARFRKLVKNMESKFPNATLAEMEAADVCIICRDALSEGAKKLPCSHIFHIDCLKSWFIQQQSCPTCRTEIPPDPVRPTAPESDAEEQHPSESQEQGEDPTTRAGNALPKPMSLLEAKMRQLEAEDTAKTAESKLKRPSLQKPTASGSSHAQPGAQMRSHIPSHLDAEAPLPDTYAPKGASSRSRASDAMQHALQMSEFYRQQANMWLQICAKQTQQAQGGDPFCSCCGLTKRPTTKPSEHSRGVSAEGHGPVGGNETDDWKPYRPFLPFPPMVPPSAQLLMSHQLLGQDAVPAVGLNMPDDTLHEMPIRQVPQPQPVGEQVSKNSSGKCDETNDETRSSVDTDINEYRRNQQLLYESSIHKNT